MPVLLNRSHFKNCSNTVCVKYPQAARVGGPPIFPPLNSLWLITWWLRDLSLGQYVATQYNEGVLEEA
jgi:hypothetical protein